MSLLSEKKLVLAKNLQFNPMTHKKDSRIWDSNPCDVSSCDLKSHSLTNSDNPGLDFIQLHKFRL